MSSQPVRTEYILGHSEKELIRLSAQGKLLAPLTAEALRQAGFGPGMKVLEVGCGYGDTTLMLAEIVGPEGRVTAIDRAEPAVRAVRDRLAGLGIVQVDCISSNLEDLPADRAYDAAFGRLVLLHNPAPARIIAEVAARVRPGGTVLFHEFDMGGARSVPPVPLIEQNFAWMRDVFVRGGSHLDMASRLPAAFIAAGLPAPQTVAGIVAGVPGHSAPFVVLGEVMRSILSKIVEAGLTTPEEMDIDTLADRMYHDAAELGSTLWFPPMLAAWSRVPA